jgi:hypothetical protein
MTGIYPVLMVHAGTVFDIPELLAGTQNVALILALKKKILFLTICGPSLSFGPLAARLF